MSDKHFLDAMGRPMTGSAAPATVNVRDGLANVLTGAGTTIDRKQYRQWQERYVSPFDVDTAYRSSWMMRKVVNVPAQDAVRVWRAWQTDKDSIALLEATERRLRVRQIMREGLLYGRLGGGVVLLGLADDAPDMPVENVQRGALRYLRAYPRRRIELGPVVTDPMDDDFGEPEFFTLKASGGDGDIRFHRSRVLVFKGQFAGTIGFGAMTNGAHPFWGESVVHTVNDAVMNAATAQDEIAGLIEEAKQDIYGIPGLMDKMGSSTEERKVMRRLEIAQASKGIHRAIVRDAAETWEQRQISWGGMPEVIRTFLSIVASASDIPATRFLGKSPDGMNATGEGDQENYDQLVQDIQEEHLRPNLDKLDAALVPSVLGREPGTVDGGNDITYEFPPLHKPSARDAAEVENREADTVSKLVSLGLLPETALAQAVANRMIESGRWPGFEAALEEEGDAWWVTEPNGDFDQQAGSGVQPGVDPGVAGGEGAE